MFLTTTIITSTEGNSLFPEILQIQSTCLTTPSLADVMGGVGGEVMYLRFYWMMFNFKYGGTWRRWSGQSAIGEALRSMFGQKLLMIMLGKVWSKTKLMQQQMR